MQQLARQIGPQGQPAAPQKGQYLAVDGQTGPAQHKGGHGHPAGQRPVGEGGHPGGHLQHPGNQPLRPLLGQPQGEQQTGEQTGCGGQQAGQGQHAHRHGKKQNEGADVQGGLQSARDRPGEGGGKAGGLKLGRRAVFPPGALAGLVKPEQQAHDQGGEQVRQIEQQPHQPAAKEPRPHHAQNKGGAAVVAEGQQPLGLGAGALAALIQLNGCPGPHRIAPHKAQGQCGGAGAVDPEQRDHHRLQQAAQIAGHPQLHHQRGQDEEGKQRGDHHVAAQLQPVPHGLHGLGGPQHQGQCGGQQPQPQQKVPVFLFSKQPSHMVPPPLSSFPASLCGRKNFFPVPEK